MNEIANNNLILAIDAPASGNIAITNAPSLKNNASNSPVWFEKISVSLTNVNAGTITNGDGVGSGDILATALKVNENSKNVIRKDDNVAINCTGTQPNPSPPPANIPASGVATVRVQNAGQTKVTAL